MKPRFSKGKRFGDQEGSNFLQRRSGQSQHRRLHAHVPGAIFGNNILGLPLEMAREWDP
jgi:hypothetical protein